MNKEEFLEWIKTLSYVDTPFSEYDSSGNLDVEQVYKDESDQYYLIEFCNHHPYEMCIDSKGFKRDCYLPTKVKKVTKKVEVISYERE